VIWTTYGHATKVERRLPHFSPGLDASAKGILSLAGLSAGQETFHADIFIQVGPVNSRAVSDKTLVRAFAYRAVRQTGKPGERHGNRPAIRKIGD